MAGLSNFGSTCFMNAVLQVVRHCDGIPERIHFLATHLKSRHNVREESRVGVDCLRNLDKLFVEMKELEQQQHSSSNPFLAPQRLLESLKNLLPNFDFEVHQDAVEFFNHLLRLLDDMENGNNFVFQAETIEHAQSPLILSTKNFEVMNDQIPVDGVFKYHFKLDSELVRQVQPTISADLRELRDDKVKKKFTGIVCIIAECPTCELKSVDNEEFVEVSIEPVETCLQVTELLQNTKNRSSKAEHLCKKCNARVTATISRCYIALPSILIVHINRFKVISRGNFEKDLSPVKVDFEIVCIGTDGLQFRYNLFAAIMHSGKTLEFGHNVSYVVGQHGWCSFNDRKATFLTQAEFEHVLEPGDYSTPYLLYYRRET